MSDEEQNTVDSKLLKCLPFDVQCVISHDVEVFGDFGVGNLIGQFAQYIGGAIKQTDTDNQEYEIDYFGLVGCVVGHSYDRVIIDIGNEDDIYFGWVNPKDFRIIVLHDSSDYIQ